MILKRMKRRHSRENAIKVCERIRRIRPEATFGADLIAGFPTETDIMFENTVEIIEECHLTHLHVFPYSERDDTPAARMPLVPKSIRRERAAHLRELGATRLSTFMKTRVGAKASVLIEKNNLGRCEQFLPVKLNHQVDVGTLISCRITNTNGEYLDAKVA